MVCPSCGRENRAGRRFCAECGLTLACECGACGTVNEPDEKFCGGCGQNLIGDAPGFGRGGALAAPPRERERRQLTVLFCDLVGSTSLAAGLDPEEWQDLLDLYRQCAQEIVARANGHVAQLLGDGMLVYFGWPSAFEDDAERAVRAGLDLVEAVPLRDSRLVVRVGIHTGLVVVGGSGAADGLAVGDTPNVAARVQSLAEPGTVLVTEATHRLVSGFFLVEARAPQSLKGVSRPVVVYRVRQSSGVRSRLAAAAAARGLTRFVGRAAERRLLRERFERARAGEGQVVLISGEPGIGKSRLAQTLRDDVAGTPHTWLEAGAAPRFANTPLYPVIAMVRQGFLRAGESAEARLARLEQTMKIVGLDLAEALPLVAPLVDLPVPPGYPAAPVAPELIRRRLHEIFAQWIIRAARLQPVVLLLEDLQWADPTTLEHQQILEERVATEPVLLLYTARPDFQPPWPLRGHHSQLTLTRLGREETREVVASAASRILPADLIDEVVGRADGIPLFAEELTRATVESGTESAREIPSTLHDSLMSRLDRLGTEAKEIAQVGAVIGREFSWSLVEALGVRPATALEAALRSLAEAELVYVRGTQPEATYHFKHALVQDAAYNSLLKARRRELHGRVARVLAERFTQSGEAQPELLAFHYTEAGDAEPAAAAWTKAGKRAVVRGAEREAVSHFRRGLETLTTLPADPHRDQQELTLQLALGQALMVNRGWGSPEAADCYRRGRSLASENTDPRRLIVLLVGLWNSTLNQEGPSKAAPLAGELLEAARRAMHPPVEALACFAQGVTLFHLGQPAGAREYLGRAVSLADPWPSRSSPIDLRLSALGFAVLASAHLGLVEEARELSRRGIDLALQSGRPAEQAWAQTYAMLLHIDLREPNAALERAERVLDACAGEPFPAHETGARMTRAWALAELGRGSDSIAAMEAALEEHKATGGKLKLESNLGLYAAVLALGGRVDEALAVLAEAEGCLPGDEESRAETLRRRAELLASQGADPASVETTFREAIGVAKRQAAKLFELRAAVRYGAWLRDRDRVGEARDLISQVLATFPGGSGVADVMEAEAFLGAGPASPPDATGAGAIGAARIPTTRQVG